MPPKLYILVLLEVANHSLWVSLEERAESTYWNASSDLLKTGA